jgi:inositol phosphorylceramide mannosyltransferase catalytic subunit
MLEQESSTLHQPEREGIPRIIHQIWYQGETQLPEKYRRFRNTWKKNHPDWKFVLWDEKSMRELVHREYAWFVSYFDGYPLDIQRMDSARYLILNSFGGFYIDMDVESFKPIDELLGDYELILSKTVGYNNAIMGSIPHHPLWQEVFNNLRKFSARPASGTLELQERSSANYVATSAGPRLFSRSVQEGRFDQQPTTRVCSGSFFEPDFPREEGGRIIRSFDRSGAYARHYGDLNWLSPFHRRLSAITGQIFKLYWFIQSKRRR